MSFNVTLPSNVCMDMFKNTPSDYSTQLAQHLQLDGQWVVGLTEVHIPCTWFNITGSNNSFTVGVSELEATSKKRVFTAIPCDIPKGYYATPGDIVTAINTSILQRTHRQAVTFEYDRNINRIKITFANKYQSFHFNKTSKMAETLGFKYHNYAPRQINDGALFEDTIWANYPPDMTGGINGLYVYTDIVEHQYVGDKMAPLLRVIPVDRIKGKNIYHIYEQPYYIPITRERIEVIQIQLRTDFGEPLVFEGGKTLVKLHFKRVTA